MAIDLENFLKKSSWKEWVLNMKFSVQNNGIISLSLDMSVASDRSVKNAIKENTKCFYNNATKTWAVYGFDTLTRFEAFLGRVIRGESTSKRGIAPTKSALKEQQKAFWKSEEGKAIKEKRKLWVIEQNKHKFEYVSEKWDIATATVLEDVCANSKVAFYKLSDTDINAMASKYEDRILDTFAEMRW